MGLAGGEAACTDVRRIAQLGGDIPDSLAGLFANDVRAAENTRYGCYGDISLASYILDRNHQSTGDGVTNQAFL